MSELRDLYIGDLIELNIETDQVSEEDILVAFDGFDMVQIERLEVGYHVTLMTMTPETYEVRIAGQSIVIEVQFTLETIEREDIFEAAVVQEQVNGLGPLWIVFGLSVLLCLVSGIWLIVRKLKEKKEKILTPYEQFYKAMSSADTQSTTYLGDITSSFKIYLSAVMSKPLEGLTTEELLIEVAMDETVYGVSSELKQWLVECDQLKYQRTDNDKNQMIKEAMKERLIVLSDVIDQKIKEKDVA